MSAILQRDLFAPNTLGGNGGGHIPPYLAAMGIGSIEIVPPSGADRLRFGNKAIAHHFFRDGHPPVPVTKSIAKELISAAASDPHVTKIDAPPPTAVYTQHGRERRFQADMKFRVRHGARILDTLELSSLEFFIYIQTCKFADVIVEAGCAALRAGTGIPVVTLNEVQIQRLRQGYLHG